jgi:hypothetical protein
VGAIVEPRLADSGLSGDEEHRTAVRDGLPECRQELSRFGLSPDKDPACGPRNVRRRGFQEHRQRRPSSYLAAKSPAYSKVEPFHAMGERSRANVTMGRCSTYAHRSGIRLGPCSIERPHNRPPRCLRLSCSRRDPKWAMRRPSPFSRSPVSVAAPT